MPVGRSRGIPRDRHRNSDIGLRTADPKNHAMSGFSRSYNRIRIPRSRLNRGITRPAVPAFQLAFDDIKPVALLRPGHDHQGARTEHRDVPAGKAGYAEIILLADVVGDPIQFAPTHAGTEAEQKRFCKAVAPTRVLASGVPKPHKCCYVALIQCLGFGPLVYQALAKGALMGIRCLFGFHRPTANAVKRDLSGYHSVCRYCGKSISRKRAKKWVRDKRPGNR